MTLRNPELTRCAVLALACEQPRHGWAIASELSPRSDLGRVWAVSRQLTYRAVDTLVADGLLERGEVLEGLGPDRVVLRPTAKGRRVNTGWLNSPVSHVRDVRTELILKLRLRDRASLPRQEFVKEQRVTLSGVIDQLRQSPMGDVVDVWRKESALAVSRFLAALDA